MLFEAVPQCSQSRNSRYTNYKQIYGLLGGTSINHHLYASWQTLRILKFCHKQGTNTIPAPHQFRTSYIPVLHQFSTCTIPVRTLIDKTTDNLMSVWQLAELCDLKDIRYFRKNYINPAFEESAIERLYPDQPKQEYRLTEAAKAWKINLRTNRKIGYCTW